MFKLIKWGVIAVVATAVVGSLAFGRHAGSYLETAAQSFRDGVRDSIPIEFELEHAEDLIEDVEPQLEEALTELAQAHVDLERAREAAEGLEIQIARQELQLRGQIDPEAAVGAAHFGTGDGERLRNARLARVFDAYRANKRAFEQKLELIARQEQAVADAEDHVQKVRLEKRRLEQQIQDLRIKQRQLEALDASTRTIDVDDTALSRARDVLDRLENRLDVQTRLLEHEARVEAPRPGADRDVVGEVREYFEQESTGRPLRSR